MPHSANHLYKAKTLLNDQKSLLDITASYRPFNSAFTNSATSGELLRADDD
jgi:hypothetical protein